MQGTALKNVSPLDLTGTHCVQAVFIGPATKVALASKYLPEGAMHSSAGAQVPSSPHPYPTQKRGGESVHGPVQFSSVGGGRAGQSRLGLRCRSE